MKPFAQYDTTKRYQKWKNKPLTERKYLQHISVQGLVSKPQNSTNQWDMNIQSSRKNGQKIGTGTEKETCLETEKETWLENKYMNMLIFASSQVLAS